MSLVLKVDEEVKLDKEELRTNYFESVLILVNVCERVMKRWPLHAANRGG